MENQRILKMPLFVVLQVYSNPLIGYSRLGKERQRMGDKLAKTVVVKLDSPLVEIVPETETEVEAESEEKDLEKVLEDVILEITNRFSEAKQEG